MPGKTAAIALQAAALIVNGAAVILDLTAGGAHACRPDTAVAASPGSAARRSGPSATAAKTSPTSAHHAPTSCRGLAGILTESGGMAATIGGYQQRQDEWTLQANLAQAELTQIASQITAANDRLDDRQSELSIQHAQIANAQAVSDFLTAQVHQRPALQLDGQPADDRLRAGLPAGASASRSRRRARTSTSSAARDSSSSSPTGTASTRD